MTAAETIDAELVEETSLALRETETSLTLFSTSDPRVALERMAEIARALVDVVKSQRLSVRIGGREHLTAEAWTTLGGMVGLSAVIAWTKPNETGDGYLARAEAIRIVDGRIVGGAESECSRAEATWRTRDPYALRSMAQTRAIGRALRGPLGQIVTLAGYDAAGADEMPPTAAQEPRTANVEPQATEDQRKEIRSLLRVLSECDRETDWPGVCREQVGSSHGLGCERAAKLIGYLRGRLEELAR
jgi:hypothetical protein